MFSLLFRLFQLIGFATRTISNSTNSNKAISVVDQLKTQPEKTPELLQSLIQRCWYINDDRIKNWDMCLHKIPETFNIENYQCLYRQFENRNVLMVVKCNTQGLQGTVSGTKNVKLVYTHLFYIRHNPSTKYIEVMTQSYEDTFEKNLQSTFGRKMMDALIAL